MLYFNNKYRIPSTRLEGWDYRSSAPYFVTICTNNHVHYFGEIKSGNMYLNKLGEFTNQRILKIDQYNEHVTIVNHVVMPNHVHILLELKNHTKEYCPNQFGPLLEKSLSAIVNHNKGRITKFAKKENIEFEWQERFHEHVIKSSASYHEIFEYITHNPSRWSEDRFYGKEN